MGQADFYKKGDWNVYLCTKCKIPKLKSEFAKDRQKKKGIKSWCKECSNQENKKWRVKNNKYIKQYTDSRFDERKKNDKKYKELNTEKINKAAKIRYRKDPAKHHEAYKKWSRKNTSYITAKGRARAALQLKAMPIWANKKYINLWYKLAKIEEKRTGKKVHIDHIYPLKGKYACGLHCEDNLQMLFATENYRKGNRYGGLL